MYFTVAVRSIFQVGTLPLAGSTKYSAYAAVRVLGPSSDSPSSRGAPAGTVNCAAASIVGRMSTYEASRPVAVPAGTCPGQRR